jgi:predicted small metal-binding protein
MPASAKVDREGMKQFACQSVVPGCEAVFSGESEREVLLPAVEHAEQDHDMDETPAVAAVQVLDHIVEAA